MDHQPENSLATAGQDVVNELSLSMQNVLEEPINLSVKKSQRCTSPSELLSNNSLLPVNARIRSLRNEEGNRLFIVSFKFGVFLSCYCTLQALQSSLHIDVLSQMCFPSKLQLSST